MEGEEVIFYCVVKGNLMFRIIWIKDGNILVLGNIFKFIVCKNDFGEYFCLVENGVELVINVSVYFDV